ncbi:uncharacterized protein MONOS_6434 [Monocercomonoides exilis]|uniref:uncharacterized protein n=1 Tax=Monocercomonoides exilis TaxID=2049356 RepID=UPI0035595BBE|nr:hypothetical protein MONOS_6434 [Monocercomonoides exilis]|eukprot:MONOS_6434.1-p1 / transcript=MONOS_6434.1 / gene=MONOS_6434 / organism=Monocercomonoides_exilis_PA203 / gene_product=unspecified product / transcript_product=unspecified product / location=Mono_scaffold00202:58915-60663(+) / protein_length=485 / sequence_SO=supercontig / SO=protein_coding / is_pseudo=false
MCVVQLSLLSMVDVKIKNLNVTKSLFSEPNQSLSSSSSSSLSSSALYLTATASGDSVLANVKVTNVKLTEGDGVVVAKSVAEGETFVVKNVTIEDCECQAGSGGGIKVELESSSKLRVGTSSAPGSETTKFNRCNCSGNGGGIMLHLEDGSHDFLILSMDFTGCTSSLEGKFLFVNGKDSKKRCISSSKFDVPRNTSAFNELEGFDRSDEDMKKFPLNVFLDSHTGASHVGKKKDGVLGRYDSWFCGFDYYPCSTITHTAQARFSGGNKNIELDPEFVLAEKVAMADSFEWEISCATKGTSIEVKVPATFESAEFLIDVQSRYSIEKIKFSIPSALSSIYAMISAHSPSFNITDCSVARSPDRKPEEIGKGGGICVSLDGDGSVVVNGTSTIDSCEAKNNGGGGAKGRGGGMMLTMASPNCKMEIAENVQFSSTHSSLNDAQYGKDVFVSCGSGVFLDSKIDATTFGFFDSSEIPTDVLKLCGR